MTTLCVETNNKNFLGSEDAIALQKQDKDILNDFAQTITMGDYYNETRQSFARTTKECSVENWDGYGAKAIDSCSYMNAFYFSQLLPEGTPIPEIYVDPDGEVTFEWYVGPRQVFSVSIGSNKNLVYAGLFGASKTHGTEYLDDELPEAILYNIHRIFSREIYFETS